MPESKCPMMLVPEQQNNLLKEPTAQSMLKSVKTSESLDKPRET